MDPVYPNTNVTTPAQTIPITPQTNSQPTDTVLPKPIKNISLLLFAYAITFLPAAFAGSAVVFIAYRLSPPPGLEFSALKAMPFVGFISVINMIVFTLILYSAFRVRVGSLNSWKTVTFLMALVFLIQLAVGILTRMLIDPVFSATNNY